MIRCGFGAGVCSQAIGHKVVPFASAKARWQVRADAVVAGSAGGSRRRTRENAMRYREGPALLKRLPRVCAFLARSSIVAFACATDRFLDFRYECGRQAQIVHSKPDKQAGGCGIRSSLSANAHVFALLVSTDCKFGNQAKDSRVKGVLESRQFGIVAIRCEHVLGEVVGSYADELDHLGKLVDQKCGGRDFDHDAHGYRPGMGLVFSLKRGVNVFQFRQCVPKFLRVGNHREHDLKIASVTRAQDRAQMSSKEVAAV